MTTNENEDSLQELLEKCNCTDLSAVDADNKILSDVLKQVGVSQTTSNQTQELSTTVKNLFTPTNILMARTRGMNCLEFCKEKIREAQDVTNSAKSCINRIFKDNDEDNLKITEYLKTRCNELHCYEIELEHCINDLNEEIRIIDDKFLQIENSLSALSTVEKINSEFMAIRAFRINIVMSHDEIDEELKREQLLCNQIRDHFENFCKQINAQKTELIAVKECLESNWSDKSEALKIDSYCIDLKVRSPEILLHPSSTNIPIEQTTEATCKQFTKNIIRKSKDVKNKSVALRLSIDNMFKKVIKDLRDQASLVDTAIDKNIDILKRELHQFEENLLNILRELTTIETLTEKLRARESGLKQSLKLAETRLTERILRSNTERCQDVPQNEIINEVKMINQRISVLKKEIEQTEIVQANLVKARTELEKEIFIKRELLHIDKTRGITLRSFYPSSTNLSGFR